MTDDQCDALIAGLIRVENRLAVLAAISLPMRGGKVFNEKLAGEVWLQGCAALNALKEGGEKR